MSENIHVFIPIPIKNKLEFLSSNIINSYIYYYVENISKKDFLNSLYYQKDQKLVSPFFLYYSFDQIDDLEFENKINDDYISCKEFEDFSAIHFGIHSDFLTSECLKSLDPEIQKRLYFETNISNENNRYYYDVLENSIYKNYYNGLDYIFSPGGKHPYDGLKEFVRLYGKEEEIRFDDQRLSSIVLKLEDINIAQAEEELKYNDYDDQNANILIYKTDYDNKPVWILLSGAKELTKAIILEKSKIKIKIGQM